MKKLSIIIPVYNVEMYIHSCVESVFQQGLNEDDFEVILVNDGTQDNSFGVISDLISYHTNIILIEQPNLGLSAARNTGLNKANGEYILFLDSDDLLFNNTMVSILSHTNQLPDLIVAGFEKKRNEEITSHMLTPKKNHQGITLTGQELFINYLNPRECYVWRTLYKKAFLDNNNLRFIPGIYFEDVPFTVECYLKAKNCIYTKDSFYIYRQRSNSIVSAINKTKLLDLNKVIAKLWILQQICPLTSEEQKKLMDTIYATFSIEIWYITHIPGLLSERKIIIKDLKERVPNLWFSNGIKQTIISIFYKLIPNTYIKLKALLA